jgi:hypothetical protein
MAVFWDVASCSLVETDRSFRGMYRLHHRGDDYKGSKSLWNIGQNLPECTAQHSRRQPFILVAVRTLDLTMKRFLTLSKDFYTTPRNVEHSLRHFCTERRNMSSGVMQSVQWLRYALGDRSLNPGTGMFFFIGHAVWGRVLGPTQLPI